MPDFITEAQLSALALCDAYRRGDYLEVSNVLGNTWSYELHVGLVHIALGLLKTAAVKYGMSEEELADVFRRGLLKAATA